MYRFSFFLIYVPFCLFFPCLCGVRSFRRLSNELGPSFTPVFNLIGQVEAMFKMAQERLYVEMQNSLKTYWETHFSEHLLGGNLAQSGARVFHLKCFCIGSILSEANPTQKCGVFVGNKYNGDVETWFFTSCMHFLQIGPGGTKPVLGRRQNTEKPVVFARKRTQARVCGFLAKISSYLAFLAKKH